MQHKYLIYQAYNDASGYKSLREKIHQVSDDLKIPMRDVQEVVLVYEAKDKYGKKKYVDDLKNDHDKVMLDEKDISGFKKLWAEFDDVDMDIELFCFKNKIEVYDFKMFIRFYVEAPRQKRISPSEFKSIEAIKNWNRKSLFNRKEIAARLDTLYFDVTDDIREKIFWLKISIGGGDE